MTIFFVGHCDLQGPVILPSISGYIDTHHILCTCVVSNYD